MINHAKDARDTTMMFQAVRMMFCFCLTAALCTSSYARADPDSLQKSIVISCLGKFPDKDKCLVTGQDFTIIKTPGSPFHFLFVPVNIIAGVESSEFWTTGYPAWFQKAWRFRHIAAPWLGRGVSPEKLAIAINSRPRRTQNQLHIHINCVRKDVLSEINSMSVSDTWNTVSLKSMNDHIYQAIQLPGSNIPDDLLVKLYQSSFLNKQTDDVTLFAALSDKGNAIVLKGKYDPNTPSTGSAQDLLTSCP